MENTNELPGQHLLQRCVIIQRDDKGYGLTVTGDNPVYVQSVKEGCAAYKAGVQVGDRIMKVNGTVVTHFNHIEVVNLIKSGSHVALTLLGNPPSPQPPPTDQSQRSKPPSSTSSPPSMAGDLAGYRQPGGSDSQREERITAIKRVLDQERQFYERTREEYMKKPSEKLQKELAESTTRIKAFDAELSALTNPALTKSNSPSGPRSAPPSWSPAHQSPLHRANSTPGDSRPTRVRQQQSFPNSDALYDDAMGEQDRDQKEVNGSFAPAPPQRKYVGENLSVKSGVGLARANARKQAKKLSLPDGSRHVRQHSSPEAFFRPPGEEPRKGSFNKETSKKISHDDFSGIARVPNPRIPSVPPSNRMPLDETKRSPTAAWNVEDNDRQFSPPPTPPAEGPVEKKGRQDSFENHKDGDEESQTTTGEPKSNTFLTVNQHHQSQMSIISMEEDEFASDDEKIEDHGPFNDLELLKNKPAHLAVFLHYLFSNSDPSSLFFWLVTESYKDGSIKEMRKWSYEIYSTFLEKSAPLALGIPEDISVKIEGTLGVNLSEESQRTLFEEARDAAAQEINDFLADFRNKRALGLGSLFGDHQLQDDNMDKFKELRVVEQTLMPHLENFTSELDSNNSTAEPRQMDRTLAMASCLTTFMKQVGVTVKSGNNANILERCSSFTQKENKSLFKIKERSKKFKNHHFLSTHYSSVTFCSHCKMLLWGIGDQGYQCTICEYNVHKGSCYDSIEESCPGTKKRTKKVNRVDYSQSFLLNRIKQRAMSETSRPYVSSTSITLSPYRGGTDSDGVEEGDEGRALIRNKKSESFDDESVLGSERDDFGSDSESDKLSPFEPETNLRTKQNLCTSETNLIAKQARLRINKPVARSESVKTQREISRKKPLKDGMHRPGRKSVAGDTAPFVLRKNTNDGDSDSVASMDYRSRSQDSPTLYPGLEALSEDVRRGHSRSPSFLSSEEEVAHDSDLDVEVETPNWQQMVDKKVLKKLKGKEIKRQEVINELIHTEKTHVRNLKVLNLVFYKPMKKGNILPYDSIQLLFPNLQELIDVHMSLMKALKKRQSETEVVNCIGDVMLERFDNEAGEQFKEACATFCNHQKYAFEQLKQKQRKEPKLAQFIQHCESHQLCRRLSLQAIISSSYQRLTKYPLLLEAIQKNTPSSHPDFKNNERAISCTKDVLAHVNQSVKECENQQRLIDLQKKIDRRQMESGNSKLVEEAKNLDLTKKKLINDGPLTWRISRTKSIDLHVLLLEDLLVLLQKQDDKLVLKCQSTTVPTGYQEGKTTHSPIIKLNTLLTRNVATDKRAFFLVSTSSVGPQIYELVAATVTERKNWYKYITDTADAYKGRERGRRGAVSLGGPRQTAALISPQELLPRVPEARREKEEEEDKLSGEEKEKSVLEEREKKEVEEFEEDDKQYTNDYNKEEVLEMLDEVQQEVQVRADDLNQVPETKTLSVPEPEVDSELDLETETEVEPDTEVEQEAELPLPPPPILVPDVETETETETETEDRLPPPPPGIVRNISDLTNEVSVDDRSPIRENLSVFSESSSSTTSSASNDTLKIRNSFGGTSDSQEDTGSSNSTGSSVSLLEQLRLKDEELKRVLEDKAKIIAELRGSPVTTGFPTSESHVNGEPTEARVPVRGQESRDLILAAILQANRLTVAVSDILNPCDDSRDLHGCGVSSPQHQLVSSTSVLNEQLTTLLAIITDRDMARERLRCDLQYANTQIQRLKQGRSSSRRSRDLPGSSQGSYSSRDDYFGSRPDSPRPSSPASTADLDSDYAPLSEASMSDYIGSEDNMEIGKGKRSTSFTSLKDRNSLSTGGYRTHQHSFRSRDESYTSQWQRAHGQRGGKPYWSDDGGSTNSYLHESQF